MKTRNKHYLTRKVSFSPCDCVDDTIVFSHSHFVEQQTSTRNIIINRDGLASIQPTVRLIRAKLQPSPPDRRAGMSNRAKLINSPGDQTHSKLMKVRMPKSSPKRPGNLKRRGRPKKWEDDEDPEKSERRLRKERRDRERYRQIEELQRKIARSDTTESSESDQSAPTHQIPPLIKNQKIKKLVRWFIVAVYNRVWARFSQSTNCLFLTCLG